MRTCGTLGEDRGAFGLYRDDLDLGIPGFQIFAYAGDGAAGADACDKNVDRAVGVVIDLGTGGGTMDRGVRGVDELTGDEAAFDLCGKLISLGDRALHALRAVCQHQLRAVCLHQLAAFHGHRLGHHDDDAIALSRGDCRKSDTGIAGGRLNDHGAFLQKSLLLRVVDHRLRDTVLDGACGVEILQLCVDLRAEALSLFDVGEFKQRGLADELVCGCINISHDGSPYYIV